MFAVVPEYMVAGPAQFRGGPSDNLVGGKRVVMVDHLHHSVPGELLHRGLDDPAVAGRSGFRRQVDDRAVPYINAVVPIPRAPNPNVLASCHVPPLSLLNLTLSNGTRRT